VQTVATKKRQAAEEVVGTVRTQLRAVIEAKITGRIAQLLVTAGQTVKTGALLAQLDAREIQARLDQATAVRDQAASDLKRYTTLFQEKTVTQAELESVQARHRVAQASVNEAETMLSYAKVTAPFDGVVTRKLADVGDLALPGKPLVELEDPNRLRLEANVPEALFERLALGQQLPVRIGALAGELEGVISELAPIADPNSRTFLVKLDLPQKPGLRAGQFGRVAIPISETAALRVPASAVVVRGQMEIAFVVVNQRTQMRLVKTGKRVGEEIELVSGVEAGEQIVVASAAQLRDGQPVVVKP
jgi:RND family efflux transporter MFP subunit